MKSRHKLATIGNGSLEIEEDREGSHLAVNTNGLKKKKKKKLDNSDENLTSKNT